VFAAERRHGVVTTGPALAVQARKFMTASAAAWRFPGDAALGLRSALSNPASTSMQIAKAEWQPGVRRS